MSFLFLKQFVGESSKIRRTLSLLCLLPYFNQLSRLFLSSETISRQITRLVDESSKWEIFLLFLIFPIFFFSRCIISYSSFVWNDLKGNHTIRGRIVKNVKYPFFALQFSLSFSIDQLCYLFLLKRFVGERKGFMMVFLWTERIVKTLEGITPSSSNEIPCFCSIR